MILRDLETWLDKYLNEKLEASLAKDKDKLMQSGTF
jgi:hypothetical protein